MPFPPPGDLPDPETKAASPVSPALKVNFFTAEPLDKFSVNLLIIKKKAIYLRTYSILTP